MVLKFDEVGDLTNSNQNHHVQVIFKKSFQKFDLKNTNEDREVWGQK